MQHQIHGKTFFSAAREATSITKVSLNDEKYIYILKFDFLKFIQAAAAYRTCHSHTNSIYYV